MTEKSPLLRNYQQEIIVRVNEAWKLHQSVMVQMPTGTGKTHVLANIVSACTGKVLIVAHRRELIEQIKGTILKLKIKNKELRISSIQTISRRIDQPDFTPDLIIIDEAHHALARTYRILWEKWKGAKFLGLTATPCRMTRNGFTDLFEVLITSWSVAEFIRKGVLSVFDYVSIQPDSMEQLLIDSLQKRGADGDYQVKEMDEVLNKQPSIERLYQSIMQFAKGKKGIVYAISIDHARKIAAYYNLQGIRSVAIDSKTPKEARRKMVEDFKGGRIQVLVNVDVFSEGFDCPDVEFVQMARPTLSLSKYLQQVGRGLRKSKGKESCMLLDNVGLCRVFGLPIQVWDWERMFRGELAGKGSKSKNEELRERRYCASAIETGTSEQECGLGLVVSHETLLDKLDELSQPPATEEKSAELKAWQDKVSGLWGLRRGKILITKAEYVTVFGIKEGMAAVKFRDSGCGLIDEDGKVVWKRKNCVSLRITRNKLVEIEMEGGNMNWLDLCNMKTYLYPPEVKRYGEFELLKVKHICYSRTKKLYSSKLDYESLIITNKGFILKITETLENVFCILKGDSESYYQIYRWMTDGSVIIFDWKNNYYQVKKDGKKIFICNSADNDWETCLTTINRLDKEAIQEQKIIDKKNKQQIWDEHKHATPFQSGQKWGLKVGNRITVPPIYRNIKPPIGKYCAVEKNYSQWGIITIDGTILIEPKYPEVSINEDGTAQLTQVTGKKKTVKLG